MLYWFEDRQDPDGSFGGGWGDDVEAWRKFKALLLGFDFYRYKAGWERVSRSVQARQRGRRRVCAVRRRPEDLGDGREARPQRLHDIRRVRRLAPPATPSKSPAKAAAPSKQPSKSSVTRQPSSITRQPSSVARQPSSVTRQKG